MTNTPIRRYTDRVQHAIRGITEAAATDEYRDAHVLSEAVQVHIAPLDPDEMELVCILSAGVLAVCMCAVAAMRRCGGRGTAIRLRHGRTDMLVVLGMHAPGAAPRPTWTSSPCTTG
jgi:hypothetical protein